MLSGASSRKAPAGAAMQVYQVLQESGAQHRFEVARRRGLTPFVGRETEVTVLGERWQRARASMGQVVVISGEAGIGKSRLVQILYERVASEPHVHLECRCSPYHQHSAFYPIVDLVERTAGVDRDETAAAKLSKLEAVIAPLHLLGDTPCHCSPPSCRSRWATPMRRSASRPSNNGSALSPPSLPW